MRTRVSNRPAHEAVLTDNVQRRAMILWIFSSRNPYAVAIRLAMGIGARYDPTPAEIRLATKYLFEPTTDLAALHQAYRQDR